MNQAMHCFHYYAHHSNKWIDWHDASVFFWDKASYYWGISQ